jgi:hypothetical protein
MPTNLYDAHKQWVSRSPDERFTSIEALLDFTGKRKRDSVEGLRSLRSLRVYASHGGALNLNGHLPHAILTNWAFSQLCQRVGAPAGYLRSLPADVAAQCLEYGIGKSADECNILTRKNADADGDAVANLAAAFTSGSYGRIWDYDVLSELQSAIAETAWRTPPSSSDDPRGLYASDRDMFVFLINDEQPIEVGNAQLSRGFFCWNSETGAATFGLTTFLYNHVCGNGVVWGADQVEELKIVHRNRALSRFYSEAVPVLNRFVENRSLDDRIKNMVGRAMNQRTGSTLEEILALFKDEPFTSNEIASAWNTGQAEGEDTTTLWGMVQGFTAVARGLQFADKRVSLERRAGALLS